MKRLALVLFLAGCADGRALEAPAPVGIPGCDALDEQPVFFESTVPGSAVRRDQLGAAPQISWTSGAPDLVFFAPIDSAARVVRVEGFDHLFTDLDGAIGDYRADLARVAIDDGAATLLVGVDSAALCALAEPPARLPVWISSSTDTTTLWIETE